MDEAEAPPEEGSGEAPDPTLEDERAQAVFDRRHLIGSLSQLREMLAAAKVNHRFAQLGLLEKSRDYHPAKFDQAIGQHRQAIELVKKMLRDLEDQPEGLPERTIDIAPSMAAVAEGARALDEVLADP